MDEQVKNWLASKHKNPEWFLEQDEGYQKQFANELFQRNKYRAASMSDEDKSEAAQIFGAAGVPLENTPFAVYAPAVPEEPGFLDKAGSAFRSGVKAYEKYVPEEIQNVLTLGSKGLSTLPAGARGAVTQGAAEKSPMAALRGALANMKRMYSGGTYGKDWEGTSTLADYKRIQDESTPRPGPTQAAPEQPKYSPEVMKIAAERGIELPVPPAPGVLESRRGAIAGPDGWASPEGKAWAESQRPPDPTENQKRIMGAFDLVTELGAPAGGLKAASTLGAKGLRAGSSLLRRAPGVAKLTEAAAKAAKIKSELSLLKKGSRYRVTPKEEQFARGVEVTGRPWRHPIGQRKINTHTQAKSGGPWRKTPGVTGKQSLREQILSFEPEQTFKKKVVPKKINEPFVPNRIQTPQGIKPYNPFKGGADLPKPTVSTAPGQSSAGLVKQTLRSIDEQPVRSQFPKLSTIAKTALQRFRTPMLEIGNKSKAGRYMVDEMSKGKMDSDMFMHKYSTEVAQKLGRMNPAARLGVYKGLVGEANKLPAAERWKVGYMRDMYEEFWKFGVKIKKFDPKLYEPNYAHRVIDVEKMLPWVQENIKNIQRAIEKTAAEGHKTKALEQQLRAAEDLAVRLSGGKIFSTMQKIPRFGKLPASMQRTLKVNPFVIKDAEQSYGAYVRGLARIAYREPAYKKAEQVFKGIEINGKREFLPADQVNYAHEYLSAWAGANPMNVEEKVFGLIRGMEFTRLITGSPRSAGVNFMQQINNVAGMGLQRTGKAIKNLIFNDEAPKEVQQFFGVKGWKDAFKKSGIADEVQFQFVGSAVPRWLQKMNNFLGGLFNRVEEVNKGTAWVGVMDDLVKKGVPVEKAMLQAYKKTGDWQFFYGKTGLPAIMRDPKMATLLQFWSYSIKQSELIASNALRAARGDKEARKFIFRSIALVAAGDIFAQKALGININNALGIGIDHVELMEAFQSLKDEDFREMWKHAKRATEALLPWSGVPGIIPQGPGPAIGHLAFPGDVVKKGWGQATEEHFMPLQIRRITDITGLPFGAKSGIEQTEDGDYVSRHYKTGMAKTKMSAWDWFLRTLIAKPQAEFEQQRAIREGYKRKQDERDYFDEIRKAFQERDFEKMRKSMNEAAGQGLDMRKVRSLLMYQNRYGNIPQGQIAEDKYKRQEMRRR